MLSSSSISSFELTKYERVYTTTQPRAALVFLLAVVCIEFGVWRGHSWFADLAAWFWETKAELVAEGHLDGEVAVFGSSVLFHGLDPLPADQRLGGKRKVVNLALNGQTLQHSTQILNRFLARNKKVRVVVLEIWNMDVEHDSWLRGPYYRFWATWDEFLQSKVHYWDIAPIVAFAANRSLPSFRYREALDNWVSTCLRTRTISDETLLRNRAVTEEMTEHLGFVPGEVFETVSMNPNQVPAARERPWLITAAGDLWLRRFVAICERHNLRLVFLQPPAPPFVESERALSAYRDAFQGYVTEIKQQYPRLSLETLDFPGYKLENFADDHHLSRKGRVRLSEDFAAWLAARKD